MNKGGIWTKKVFVTALALLSLLTSYALAIDLEGMSLEQLLALRSEVDAAIWESDAWSAAVLPAGVYTVGQDVPDGRWVIRAHGEGYATIVYGYNLTGADHLDELVYYGKVCPADKAGDSAEYGVKETVSLETGGVLVIRDAAVELSRWLPLADFISND